MDIHALLSPESKDSVSPPSSANSSPRRSRPPRPSGGKRTASGLSNEITRSPDRVTSEPASRPRSGHQASTPGDVQQFTALRPVTEAPDIRALPQHQTQQFPPTSNAIPIFGTPGSNVPNQPSQRPAVAHGHSSTTAMETLVGES